MCKNELLIEIVM